MATKLTVNGIEIHVLKRKVKIFDDHDTVSDDDALLLVKYLYEEGFIGKQAINCEIIVDDQFE